MLRGAAGSFVLGRLVLRHAEQPAQEARRRSVRRFRQVPSIGSSSASAGPPHHPHERQLTLLWKPSVPIGPRNPVTYHVEIGPDSITGYPECKVKLYKTGGRWSRPAA